METVIAAGHGKDTSLPAGQLYNMAQDPGEERNLYDERPEVVKRLRAQLDKFLSEGRSAPRR